MDYQFLLLSCIFTTSTASTRLALSCCKGSASITIAAYYPPDSKCIIAVQEQKTWKEAWYRSQQLASSDGYTGKLLSIPNDATWQFVVNEFDGLDGILNNEKIGGQYWIALKAPNAKLPDSENDFKWYTDIKTPGSTFAVVQYADGTTNSYRFDASGEQCVRISDENDMWKDAVCDKPYYFLAEITDPNPPVSTCNSGELDLGGICYSHSGNTKANWFEAFQACRAQGGVVGGAFDQCSHVQVKEWAFGKSALEPCWSNFGKWNPSQLNDVSGLNNQRYTMLMDEYGCNTLSSHTLESETFDSSPSHWLYSVNPADLRMTVVDAESQHCYICMKHSCQGSPCQNGGVCFKDPSGTQKCSCPSGFYGDHCESVGQRTMDANGYCQVIQTTSTATTTTTPTMTPTATPTITRTITVTPATTKTSPLTTTHTTYDITTVTLLVNPCNPSPCQNAGVCSENDAGQAICDCSATQYEGPVCQNPITIGACTSYPCRKNSTCESLKWGKFICHCLAGYEGKNCGKDIEECESNPCLNKGTCTSAINSYNCDCLAAFTGAKCEMSLTTCDIQEKEELRKRVAMVVTWSFSSTGLMIMLGILLILFLILLDFSLHRILHIGQELSLLAAHIIAIFGRTPTVMDTAAFCDDEATGNPPKFSIGVCKLIAVCLHYLYLVHFSFIFLEAIHNYTVYTYVTIEKPLLNRLKAIALGFLVPAVPVSLTTSIWLNSYIDDKTCWLDFSGPNFWGEFVPAILMIPMAVILSEAADMRQFIRISGVNEQQRTSAIANSHGILILGPLSMAAWLIGALGVDQVDLSLYTLASMLNIILGVCFIVFHTVGNEKARTIVKKLFCCGSKPEHTPVDTFELYSETSIITPPRIISPLCSFNTTTNLHKCSSR